MNNKKITAYDIKRGIDSYYFDRKTLKFFGQTMAMFKVYKINNNLYQTIAPRKYKGQSVAYWKHEGLNIFKQVKGPSVTAITRGKNKGKK